MSEIYFSSQVDQTAPRETASLDSSFKPGVQTTAYMESQAISKHAENYLSLNFLFGFEYAI